MSETGKGPCGGEQCGGGRGEAPRSLCGQCRYGGERVEERGQAGSRRFSGKSAEESLGGAYCHNQENGWDTYSG